MRKGTYTGRSSPHHVIERYIDGMKPFRVVLRDFPEVVIHAAESKVKRHPDYAAAKSGDALAARRLVRDLYSADAEQRLVHLVGEHEVELVAVHALEAEGVNEIPIALAHELERELGLSINESVVQTNSVGHTGASGFHRLANQALFAGEVRVGVRDIVVDEFVGQGGTLANLLGFLAQNGGQVLGATVLTGPYSATLAYDEGLVGQLRARHGQGLGAWWRERFGFGFDCLTRSEARYLANTADADTVRDRLAAAGLENGS